MPAIAMYTALANASIEFIIAQQIQFTWNDTFFGSNISIFVRGSSSILDVSNLRYDKFLCFALHSLIAYAYVIIWRYGCYNAKRFFS